MTLLVSQPPQSEADELAQMKGTWSVQAMDVSGKPAPPEKRPKQITIENDNFKGLGQDLKIKLDSSQQPKWIDLTFTRDGKDYPIRAIYELKEKQLRIAMPVAQLGKEFTNERPKSFESKPNSYVAIVTLKRE
jgi:uncharacterized protein (TIGR03067 family)